MRRAAHGTWEVVGPMGLDDGSDDELSALALPGEEDPDDPGHPGGRAGKGSGSGGRRHDPLWERPPARVGRYVLATEKRLVCLRRHLVVLAEPVASCIAGLGAVIWLAWQVRDADPLPNLLFIAWAALLVRALWKWLQWRGDWFIATDKRLLLTYGVVKRQVAMMPLSKVTDMSYNRSLLGRFLGYGELVMESAGQDQALSDVDRLPMPDQVYVRICEQLFGQVGEADTPKRRKGGVRRLARKALPSRFR